MMSEPEIAAQVAACYCFESYGVKVKLEGNDRRLIADAARRAQAALVGNVKPIRSRTFHHEFQILKKGASRFRLLHEDQDTGWGTSRRLLLKYFDSVLRVSVGEYAVDRVFLHAGAVGWKEKAILLPAHSFKGKSTLVSELVKLGAQYYSDEYAVLDPKGMLHPFARPISMRTDDGKCRAYDVSVEQLNGKYGSDPIPVGSVLFTEFLRGRNWRAPRVLSPGAAMLALIPFSLSIRKRPDPTMNVLKTVSETAFVGTGKRGEAAQFAKQFLDFLDHYSSNLNSNNPVLI
ncbi:MAG: hypothetical protein JO053_05975 [Acidobacteria bacterium]|nr:hypothetical protein [Acidobacteriota bacterium]